ncbi:iron-containing alcohol dehydrogenase [uncultured Flavonifractor sp.]|uniref:iron-containing alcohol dehydrogenase n=1 Tax=uncultured Flavonifractor sp. TaxID=1193534 RepID=UPI00262C90D7|nr:iron-containing alcohol dehydrogenase [uncultured Flavonifractor sp.]
MKDFTFSFPTRVIFGRDAEGQAGELAAPFGPNVMLLYGSDRIRRSSLLDRLTADLETHGLTVTLFGGIQENPLLSKAEEGRRLAREKKITLLLAVGGGSVIDTAKAVSLGAKSTAPLWDIYSGKGKAQKALPIGVVLTTAATASEANSVSVLCHDELHLKVALEEPLTRPRFALMDPALTFSLPPRQTASCGVDIFSHAFERYFHKGQQGTLRSQMCAAVMRTVIAELPKALARPDDYDARSQLMWAATVAHSDMLGFEGDFACHAISHVLTTALGLPHGVALGILMTAWCKYMLTDETQAIADFSTLVWQVPPCSSQIQTAQNGISAFQEFLCSAGLPVTLREAGFGNVSLEELAGLALPGGAGTLGGNFRPLDYSAVLSLLQLARG